MGVKAGKSPSVYFIEDWALNLLSQLFTEINFGFNLLLLQIISDYRILQLSGITTKCEILLKTVVS